MPYRVSVILPRILVRLKHRNEARCSICGREFRPFDRRVIKANGHGRRNGNGRLVQRCVDCGHKARLV